MSARKPIKNGDVFETVLPDGRYGAIRVIKNEDKSCLIATTPFIDKEPVDISHPLLQQILVKNFGSWKQEMELTGYSNTKLRELRHVGNIPLTQKEESIKLWFGVGGFGFCSWGEWVGRAVYNQWRWDHDREAYEADALRERKDAERAAQVQPKPGRMLDDTVFWPLIEQLDWSKTGNDEGVIEPVVAAVAALKKADIFKFEETLSYKLFLLDTREHASHAFPLEDELMSVDQFLYARCVVVANGREFYENVLQDPSAFPQALEFEALLSISDKAFLRKTRGQEMEFTPGCSYETYSNRQGWK